VAITPQIGHNPAMLKIITASDSIAGCILLELRDQTIQKDRTRFRRNLQRLGWIAGMAVSAALEYESVEVQTPLAKALCRRLTKPLVVTTILRAGLPFQQGLLEIFDGVKAAYISAYRKHDGSGSFSIALEYVSCPDLNGKDLLLADPMLATGRSIVAVLQDLLKYGRPRSLHVLSVVAAQAGVSYVAQSFPQAQIWTFALDPELNSQAYIVPGLGDAGDLASSPKLQN
jgi:uracil phosphoribosyltransferase